MKRLGFLFFFLLSPFAFAGEARVFQCPMHPWIKADKPAKCTICGMDLVAAKASDAPAPEGVVALSASIINAIGIETTAISTQPLTRSVRVNGAIEDDDTRHRLITARAEGRVEKLHANLVGAPIRRGEPLYELYSPELQAAQRELVQIAKAGALTASALPAARARLEKMGLTAAQLDDLVKTGEPHLVTTVYAPDDGTIVAKSIYEGQWIKTGDTLLQIADFAKMWFIFEAYEQDIPWLHLGQTVQITTRAVPGEIIEAPIDFIDPNFNEATHTTKVRATLPNPHPNSLGEKHQLFHRVLAEARVLVESPAVLAAPRSSILDAGLGPVAYVDLASPEPGRGGSGHYAQRKLRLGRRGDSLVEVLDGLKAGERVVTSGALLIDAQAQLAHEAAGHDHGVVAEASRLSPLPPAAAAPLNSQPSTLNSLSTLATVAIDAADALASDDFARYQKIFPSLAPAAAPFAQLPKLELGDSLKAARASFEPWSTAVADLLKPHRAHLGLKIFQCPMTPVLGKGRWLQRGQPLKNPFFGSAMPDCGEEVP
ncbi:MAG: efflux RND transporter periplasmic adaptor subunit [Verrucomicrobia bacterium]|nr:efflux RND transporter periplasmic adaptor subunit [Verrucomicrobiota bacterium]